ncbi:MAG: YIP1 family protein [Negativicutes bacterium]|nr:YIP1 family protein [Negativicutes bacterium]
MGNFLETLYDVLFSPRTAMKAIAVDRKLAQAFAAFFLSVTIPLWAMYFGLKAAGLQAAAYVIAMLQFAGSICAWFAGAAIFGLTAELFGGRGSAAGLFAAMGFAHLPRIFAIPLLLAAALVPAGVRPLIMAGTAIIIMGWTIYLDILAIKGAYGVSGAKALLVVLFPIAALVVLGIIVAVFIGATVISALPLRIF